MLKTYFKNSPQLGVSLVMVLPLLVIYELGLLVVGWRALNGADLVTQRLLTYLGQWGFVGFNAVLLGAFAVAVHQLRKRKKLDYRFFGPLLAESAVYALCMGTFILFVMQETHLLGGGGALQQQSVLTRLVISAGAGLHEELVFRLGMLGGIAALWGLVGNKLTGFVVALLVSSVLFSLAHFIVEPFGWFPFWYRTIAGAIFGLLFKFRGFAVAAYTHALYDVYVLLLA